MPVAAAPAFRLAQVRGSGRPPDGWRRRRIGSGGLLPRRFDRCAWRARRGRFHSRRHRRSSQRHDFGARHPRPLAVAELEHDLLCLRLNQASGDLHAVPFLDRDLAAVGNLQPLRLFRAAAASATIITPTLSLKLFIFYNLRHRRALQCPCPVGPSTRLRATAQLCRRVAMYFLRPSGTLD